MIRFLSEIGLFRWRVGDRPAIKGRLVNSQGEITGVIGAFYEIEGAPFRSLEGRKIAFDATTSKVDFVMQSRAEIEGYGSMTITALFQVGSSELTAGISDSDTTAEIADGSGLPENGYALIGSEWVEYTLSGTTLTLTRGALNSDAVSHLSGVSVQFAGAIQSVSQALGYSVYSL